MRSREKKSLVSVLSCASTTKWAPKELFKGRHHIEQCVYPYQAYGAPSVWQSQSGPATRGHAADRSPAPRSSAPPPQRTGEVGAAPTHPKAPARAPGRLPRCRRLRAPVQASGPAQIPLRPPPRRRPRGAMPLQRSGPGGRREAEPRYSPAAGSALTAVSAPAESAARHSTRTTQRARRPIPLGSDGPRRAPPTPALSLRPPHRRDQSAAALKADYWPLAAAHATPGNGWLYMARSDWLGGGPARPSRPPVSK